MTAREAILPPPSQPRATLEDLRGGVTVPDLVTPLLDVAAALHGGKPSPAPLAYLSDADEVTRAVSIRLPRLCTCLGSCRGEGGLGAGWRCAMLPERPTLPPVDERTALEVQRQRAERAERHAEAYEASWARQLSVAASERDAATSAASRATAQATAALTLLATLHEHTIGPVTPRACGKTHDVATCFRCSLDTKIEAALRGAGLPVPGEGRATDVCGDGS